MLTAEQTREIKELVVRIQSYQGGLTDAAFCRKWSRYIGTADLWRRRLCAGELADVSAKRLPLLRALCEVLQTTGASGDTCKDLPFYSLFMEGLQKLEGQTTDRRIFCVLAAVGVGKSTACAGAIQVDDAEIRRRILITVPITWRENKGAILHGIARALDCDDPNLGADPLLNAIKLRLTDNPTLIFDEAHQGGVMLMRILKDLVNASLARVVYVALRTEYERVRSASRDALMEARQFTRRCLQPVFEDYACGTLRKIERESADDDSGDVVLLLQHRTKWTRDVALTLAETIVDRLRLNGNLSTLSDAIDLARQRAAKAGRKLTPEDVEASVSRICGGVRN